MVSKALWAMASPGPAAIVTGCTICRLLLLFDSGGDQSVPPVPSAFSLAIWAQRRGES